MLASYNRELWENYHLLFWLTDGDLPALDSLESLQQAAIDGNQRNTLWSGKNYYMLRVRLEAVETNAYELATDHGGAAFRRQAAERMKESVGEETLLAVTVSYTHLDVYKRQVLLLTPHRTHQLFHIILADLMKNHGIFRRKNTVNLLQPAHKCIR